MKNGLKKMSMRRRMMISFSVPLLLVQVLIFALCYPYLLKKYKSQLDYSMEQSVNQAVHFLESYIRNMEYLAELVGNNSKVQEILASEDFFSVRPLDIQYQEFYSLNKEFSAMEFSNAVYRFGLFIPDDIIYSSNNYYFYGENILKGQRDYLKMQENFVRGKNYIAMGEGRSNPQSLDTKKMLHLYHIIKAKDGTERNLGICRISVAGEIFAQVMEDANITSNGLVCLVDGEGNGVAASNQEMLEQIKEQNIFLLKGESGKWEHIKLNGIAYYSVEKRVWDDGWKMVSLIPVKEYDGQYNLMYLVTIASVIIMIAVIMATSYFLSGYYVSRLIKLRQEMECLQKGNLNVQLPLSQQGDEIEEVYRNFNFMVEEVRWLIQEHYQLGKNVKMAELRALQAQINPHFLYNTLDLVNWIAMDYGAGDIEKIAWNLARFYRLSLNHGKSLISIEEELEHVQVYVNIQRFHYDDAISLTMDVPEELMKLACLNIILQPFVENSIIHGIAQNPQLKDCTIRIRAERDEDDILFCVLDNGPGMTKDQMESVVSIDAGQANQGYGIKNINFRIKLCFGEKYGVRYESVLGEGTAAYIRIPALSMEEAEERGL